MAVGVPIQASAARAVSLPNAGLALAGLVATAGVIHVVAAIEHVTETWALWVFFALVGIGQLYAGYRIYRFPEDRRLLTVAAIGCVVVALLWIFSRTSGIPFGPEAGKISSVGVADTIATLQEIAFAAIVLAVLRRPADDEPRLTWFSSALGVRLTCAVLSMTLFMAALGGHEH